MIFLVLDDLNPHVAVAFFTIIIERMGRASWKGCIINQLVFQPSGNKHHRFWLVCYNHNMSIKTLAFRHFELHEAADFPYVYIGKILYHKIL